METIVTKNEDVDLANLGASNLKVYNEVDTKVFARVLKSTPEIEIVSFSKDNGDVVISVKQEDVINKKYLIDKNFIVKTKFFANFVGELLVRQNMEKFVNLLVKIDALNYDKSVCGYNHKNFGMSVCEQAGTLKFQFHMSLIQDILTEDINSLVKLKS